VKNSIYIKLILKLLQILLTTR